MRVARGIVSFAVRELIDEDGRPVAEIASPLYRDGNTDLPACPYADSRLGSPMNRSALRQMTAVWPELVATMTGLSDGTVHGAWAAAVHGLSLPLVAPSPVPRLVSGVFRASLGLSQVFSAMMLQDEGIADLPLSSLGDGESFFAALDEGRWLIGTHQVCAGTKPMIITLFEALEAGTGTNAGVPGAPAVVGLHVAHLASQQRLARRGASTVIPEVAPWMRAVLAVPDRPPEHARRLFPKGRAPDSLERYLAVPLEDREAAFSAELDRLG